jgi:sirohydrochlorin ferrochelatase
MKIALLLIAHGSRQPEANDDLHAVAAEMRRRGDYPIVETAFLELAEPTIETAGRRCVEQGAQHVILVPYFLSAGVHVQDDLQEHCRQLSVRYPEITFRLARPLGPHPLLCDLVALRAHEVD